MQNKIALAVAIIAAFAVVGFAYVSNTSSNEQHALAANAQVVRDGSHRLSTAEDEKAVLVEFLDFECEACAAAYPLVEELKADYGDKLTFVSRYFPMPGHPNSMNAALAVEAAAQQGEFEAMYHRMFETQKDWSHSQESQAKTFRGYARDLGLDMKAYDQAIDDPATAARVTLDKSDGVGLGVTGTPTFFLDGKKIQPSTEKEFRTLIEEAIRQ
ncbi:DsbA family protein [Arthrobacter sp. H14]|uniref:DsbA family protein n=1 Tax=Arthrobacter sp. H14 TaxID=1312959 RepID=UPI0006864EC8|nr:thioredoxin domain-containing protein [Arthrobacter sp. H14]